MRSKYYNKSFDCSFEFVRNNRLMFTSKKLQVILGINNFAGTDMLTLEQLDHFSDFKIEGVIIPERDTISFTGLLGRHGRVDIDFDIVK